MIEILHTLEAAGATEGPNPLPVLLGILVGLGVVGLAVWGISRSRRGKAPGPTVLPPPPAKPPAGPAKPPAAPPTLQLAKRYYELRVETEQNRAKEAWAKLFLRWAPMLQELLGLGRRDRQEGMSDRAFLQDAEIALSNFHIDRVLGEQGFTVSFTPEAVDRESVLAGAQALDPAVLQKELEKQERLCRHYGEAVDCSVYLHAAEEPLRQLVRAVNAGDAGACRRLIESLRQALESRGCFPLYAGDPPVAAQPQLLRDFTPEAPGATELPGLYFKNRQGAYALIGNCVGTRRAKP